MSTPTSDDRYEHRFHAGNIGDVWKHVITVAILESLTARHPALLVCDCHAGAGVYRLGGTGEWSEGIGKLFPPGVREPQLLERYRELVTEAGFSTERRYPGSPWIEGRLLRKSDSLLLNELDPVTFQSLGELTFEAPTVSVRNSDGVAALETLTAEPGSGAHLVAFLDPPWSEKSDWSTIPRRLHECWRRRPDATYALWYPIKSYTRINAMLQRLREDGLPYAALDLITTPLEFQRNRLNGSGMLLVNAPLDALNRICESASVIGERCKTARNHWHLGVTTNGSALV